MKKSKYLYTVGEKVKTKTGEIEILEQIRVPNGKNDARKGYKYKCVIDNDIDIISESDLKNGSGCKVCSGRKVVKGINDISTTHPHLVQYFINIEDAYKYNHGSEVKVVVFCPNCRTKKDIMISNLCKRGFKCDLCNSNKSLGEVIMFNVLTQLNINFDNEITFDWSKNVQVDNPKLCGNKRYDFYLNNYNILIETHGMQHYEGGFERIKSNKKVKTVQEEHDNDEIKKQLALENGIKPENYIVIDCRYSDFIYIRDNILNNSRLQELFDLNKINWNECIDSLNTSIIKEISDMWNSIKDINKVSTIFKMNRNTVREKLKIGRLLNFTDYNVEEEILKRKENSINIMTKNKMKKVRCVNNGMVFNSIKELIEKSKEIFGIQFIQSSISAVCRGKQKQHKGYIFEFV